VSCAETAEPIDLPFDLWTWWTEGNTSSIIFARWRQCAHMGGHIGTTWRLQLNRPSTAKCGLMSNYFDHSLLLGHDAVLRRCGLLLQME